MARQQFKRASARRRKSQRNAKKIAFEHMSPKTVDNAVLKPRMNIRRNNFMNEEATSVRHNSMQTPFFDSLRQNYKNLSFPQQQPLYNYNASANANVQRNQYFQRALERHRRPFRIYGKNLPDALKGHPASYNSTYAYNLSNSIGRHRQQRPGLYSRSPRFVNPARQNLSQKIDDHLETSRASVNSNSYAQSYYDRAYFDNASNSWMRGRKRVLPAEPQLKPLKKWVHPVQQTFSQEEINGVYDQPNETEVNMSHMGRNYAPSDTVLPSASTRYARNIGGSQADRSQFGVQAGSRNRPLSYRYNYASMVHPSSYSQNRINDNYNRSNVIPQTEWNDMSQWTGMDQPEHYEWDSVNDSEAWDVEEDDSDEDSDEIDIDDYVDNTY